MTRIGGAEEGKLGIGIWVYAIFAIDRIEYIMESILRSNEEEVDDRGGIIIWWCSIVDELHPISGSGLICFTLNETVTFFLRWRRLL